MRTKGIAVETKLKIFINCSFCHTLTKVTVSHGKVETFQDFRITEYVMCEEVCLASIHWSWERSSEKDKDMYMATAALQKTELIAV